MANEALKQELANLDEIDSKLTELETKKQELETAKAAAIAAKSYTPPVVGGSSNSIEAMTLRSFGVSHPGQLLKIDTSAPQYAHVPVEHKHVAINFKKSFEVGRFSAQIFNGEPLDLIGDNEKKDRAGRVKSILETRWGKEVLAPAIKAFGTGVSGGGAEWVPTGMAANYIPEFNLEHLIEKQFVQVPMPTNPFDMPKINSGTKARIATQGAAMTGGQFSTAKITLSATKLAEYYELPEELDEDSAPDFLLAARAEVMEAQIKASESAIINGDDDGTHIDSDTQAGAADLAEKAWKGLRRQALANSATVTFANATVTEAKLASMFALGGKFFTDPNGQIIIVGPNVIQQILTLPSVVTVDKMGPNATVLKGQLGSYQGRPIIVSQHMREDLNASGVYDGITLDRASIVLVNAKRFMFGQRRPIMIKVQQDLAYQDRWLVASYRRAAFNGHAQSASEKSVVLGINIAKL